MNDIENKNTIEISAKTHKRITEVTELTGVKTTTLYKDLEFLKISTIKDNENLSWISNEDFERLLLLRKYIEINGRRTGFDEKKMGELVLAKNNDISKNKNGNLCVWRKKEKRKCAL